MPELIHAVESIERLAVQFEGMTLAAKVLRSIGSLEGYIKELETSRDALQKTVGELTVEREAKHKEIDAEVASANQKIVDAIERAKQIELQSEAKAAEIIAKAVEDATLKGEAATKEQESTLQEVRDLVIQYGARAEILNKELVTLTSERDALKASTEEAQAVLTRILDTIESFKKGAAHGQE